MSEWDVIVAELRWSGLLELTRGGGLVRGVEAWGVLGDWYEERGRDEEAAYARRGMPVTALQHYLGHRLGWRPSVHSVWALLGFA